jgi:hypothetical protein
MKWSMCIGGYTIVQCDGIFKGNVECNAIGVYIIAP